MSDSVSIPKWALGVASAVFLSVTGALFGVYQAQLYDLESKIQHHAETPGHSVMFVRVDAIEKAMDEMKQASTVLQDNVQKLVRNQVRMCQKENVQCED